MKNNILCSSVKFRAIHTPYVVVNDIAVVCTAQMCILGDLNNKIASCIPSNVFHGQFFNVSSSEHGHSLLAGCMNL
ncbi:hypothetical protein T09_703 [Trichinella sp. T9]|nr:hypothetical protein T09_703 [Trichinella sp. T9]